MTRPLRYPVGCETSFETAAGRAAKHPHLAEALQILEGLAGRLERLPAEIPADVPDLTGGPQTWSIGTVARRAAGGLVGLFRGDPQRLWPGLIEHLQHLLHVVRAGTGPDNATGGAVLLAGSCLLPDHPWARLWAMAGSLRMAAWLQSPGPQAGPAELKDWLAAAAMIASRLPELCPALPAGAATVLTERIGRPIEPAAGLFSMQPSDGQLAELLGRSPEEAATAYASRIRQLRDDRLAGEALAGPAEPDRGELEEICRNVLTLRAHMHIKHDFGQRIDWSTVLNGDIESNVSLNHHGHIRALADGYAAYDQQSYADHAVRLLRSWFDQSPSPAVRGELQWRTLEVGNRLIDAWPAIAARLIDYPAFARSCLVDLIRWSLASARYLCVFAGPWNNWLQVECAGGLMATALLAEWRDAELLRALFEQRLAWINRHMFLPDGMQAENAPHYHRFPWWALYRAALFCQVLGVSVRQDLCDLLGRAAEPLWQLRLPDHSLPPLSDASPARARADEQLRLVGQHRSRPELLALTDRSAEARTLPPPCQHLPHAGYTVVRTGWAAGDDYLLFDHGFFGTNHQHEDKLTFLYGSGGRLLIGDAGIYRYSRDAWEHYYRGAWGHNVVMVDDKQQCRTLDHYAGLRETTPDPDACSTIEPGRFALLSGWYRNGFAPRSFGLWDRQADRSVDEAARDRSIQHQRLLLYLWRRGLLVIDRLVGSGAHELRQIFHLQPFELSGGREPRFQPGTLRTAGPRARLQHDRQTGVVLVHAEPGIALESYCGQTDPPRGWTALYGQQPSHDLHYVLRAELPAVLAVWIEPVSSRTAGGDWPELTIRAGQELIEFDIRTAGQSFGGRIDPAAVTVTFGKSTGPAGR